MSNALELSVRADYARLAASCMAVHDIRYYLSGILIEPRAEGGAYIVGCDGHRLCVVIDESAVCAEPTILGFDKAFRQKMPKPLGKSLLDKNETRLGLLEVMGSRAAVLLERGVLPRAVFPNAVLKGNFPKWRDVMPKFSDLKRGTADCYRTSYVSDTLETFRDKRDKPAAIAYQAEKEQAILFHIVGEEHVALLVMPMRRYDSPKEFAKFSASYADIKRVAVGA